MKYAHIDNESGGLLGWYSKDIHKNIPKGCILVEDSVWKIAVGCQANLYKDGVFLREDGETLLSTEEVKILRKKAYSLKTDPLLNEAIIKRLQGEESSADECEQQALQLRGEIQKQYPLPIEEVS